MFPARYTVSARFYDVLSLERLVYRAGRVAAIEALGLQRGMRVLDLGCGTGLSHPLLIEAVGTTGAVIGVDSSPQMLQQARRRARRHDWLNVQLVQADITELGEVGTVDAVIAVYALSVVPGWERAWARALAHTRRGGRMAVVDLQLPVGAARLAAPLARLACAAGGSDINAHPWTALEYDCTDVTAASRRGGHIQIRVGTRP
ncbi:MAG: methyltransferase domain-containing protein [Nakamurella sp.]